MKYRIKVLLIFLGILILGSLGWLINPQTDNKDKVVSGVIEKINQEGLEYSGIVMALGDAVSMYPASKLIIVAPYKFDRIDLSVYDSTYDTYFPDTVNNKRIPLFLNAKLNNLGTNTIRIENETYYFSFHNNPYSEGQIFMVYKDYEGDFRIKGLDILIQNFNEVDAVNWVYVVNENWAVLSKGYEK